jgi:hypothetical protein
MIINWSAAVKGKHTGYQPVLRGEHTGRRPVHLSEAKRRVTVIDARSAAILAATARRAASASNHAPEPENSHPNCGTSALLLVPPSRSESGQ